MATIDPAKAAARRKAQRANAKAMKKGTASPIAGMAKAAAKTVETRSGPKTSETAHLSAGQFKSSGMRHIEDNVHMTPTQASNMGASPKGKHRSGNTATASRKNALGSYDAPARGRHATRAETGPRHRSGNTPDSSEGSKIRDLAGAVRDRKGTGRVGKHRKTGA